MADKTSKGVPSKVTHLKSEDKMVLLKRRGQKESRVLDIPADNDLTKANVEGRLVKTSDLDETKTKTWDEYITPPGTVATETKPDATPAETPPAPPAEEALATPEAPPPQAAEPATTPAKLS